MDNKDIRYAYALNSSENLVHISEVIDRKQSFRCPGCTIALTPALGKIRKHHFRHDENGCGFESYLHNAAKNAFYTRFVQAKEKKLPLPIVLESQIQCRSFKAQILNKSGKACISTIDAIYDLTTLFERAQLEHRDTDTKLIPDILLTHSSPPKHKCYIEIFVTHRCSDDKVGQGIPIIEFNVQNEEDIEYVRSGKYDQSNEAIKLHHFKVKIKYTNECSKACPENSTPIGQWSTSLSGRLSKEVRILSEVKHDVSETKSCWPDAIEGNAERLLIKSMLKHNDPENSFPNCFRCNNFSSHLKNQITCRRKESTVSYDEARKCMHYEVSVD